MSEKIIYSERHFPRIYTTIEYLLGDKEGTKRMLGIHDESSARLQITSRTFQRVEVPLG
jgi:hypothetical protein